MVTVQLSTSLGDITLALDEVKAPKTVENFVKYVQDGHFDGTLFHRVIDGFMIQGGGFSTGLKEKSTRAPIQNEASSGLKNLAYTVSMARTNDPHSATSQFFINVKDNPFLDYRGPSPQDSGYCVFGHVTQGQETVDKIKSVKTGRSGFHQDVPEEEVLIIRAQIL